MQEVTHKFLIPLGSKLPLGLHIHCIRSHSRVKMAVNHTEEYISVCQTVKASVFLHSFSLTKGVLTHPADIKDYTQFSKALQGCLCTFVQWNKTELNSEAIGSLFSNTNVATFINDTLKIHIFLLFPALSLLMKRPWEIIAGYVCKMASCTKGNFHEVLKIAYL